MNKGGCRLFSAAAELSEYTSLNRLAVYAYIKHFSREVLRKGNANAMHSHPPSLADSRSRAGFAFSEGKCHQAC